MDHAQHCRAAGATIRRMAEVVTGADPTTPVPTCPGWDVRALVVHLGAIHRWAAEMVARQAPRRIDRHEDDPGRDLAGWLAAGADVVEGMSGSDPDAPMWAWGADQHVRFWSRRMLHETGVHFADLALALGCEPKMEPAVAVDGVDELFDNLPTAAYFSPTVTNLRGEGSLHLHATDAPGEWMIDLGRDGFSWRHDHGKGTVAVRGTALDLLLAVYGRRTVGASRYEVFGDRALLDFWLANARI